MSYLVISCFAILNLGKHGYRGCVKSVLIRSFSGSHFPVFSPNVGKYGPENSNYRHVLGSTMWSHILTLRVGIQEDIT